jgi:hypothetical protein
MTVLKFIGFDHQASWAMAVGDLTAVGPRGGTGSRRGPQRLRPIRRAPRQQAPRQLDSTNAARHGGKSPEPENCVKMIEIYRKNRDATGSVGLEPQPLASRRASLATTLQNHMCPY